MHPSHLGTGVKRPLRWDGQETCLECNTRCPKPEDISAAWATPALPSARNGLRVPTEWRRLEPPGSGSGEPLAPSALGPGCSTVEIPRRPSPGAGGDQISRGHTATGSGDGREGLRSRRFPHSDPGRGAHAGPGPARRSPSGPPSGSVEAATQTLCSSFKHRP